MCIAIASLKGTAIPSDRVLENCFRNNPDGGGFAYAYGGQVIIKKGFMKLKDLLNAIHKADEEVNLKERGVLIHTRITTHGGTNPSMTHPFPIVADEGALKKLTYRSPYAVIHNGIISLTSAEATAKKDMSDTAVFIEKYLTKIASNRKWFNNPSNIDLIEDLIDSKMAILNANGDIIMTSGFTKDTTDGNYYSNTSYMDNYYRYSKYTSYYDWYDDAWYDGDYPKDYHGGYKQSCLSNYADYLTKEGYTRDKNGCWTKKDKKEKEEVLVPLMELKPDEVLITYENGEAIEYDETLCFYVTEDYEVYSNDRQPIKDSGTDCTILTRKLLFEDYGEIFSAEYYPKEFRVDCYIPKNLLTGYEETVGVSVSKALATKN